MTKEKAMKLVLPLIMGSNDNTVRGKVAKRMYRYLYEGGKACRLSFTEKDDLAYLNESDMLDDFQREALQVLTGVKWN